MKEMEMDTRQNNTIPKPDIISIISDIVPLRRTGKYLIGLCPLHEDRNPSFTVNPDKQTFYCYGCHAHGDVIEFIRAYRGLSFKDALSFLGIAREKPTFKNKRERLTSLSKELKGVELEISYRLFLKRYSNLLACFMRVYSRLVALRYDFFWEDDCIDEHLPELLRQAKSMEEAEYLMDWVTSSKQWRHDLEVIHGIDQKAKFVLYRTKVESYGRV